MDRLALGEEVGVDLRGAGGEESEERRGLE